MKPLMYILLCPLLSSVGIAQTQKGVEIAITRMILNRTNEFMTVELCLTNSTSKSLRFNQFHLGGIILRMSFLDSEGRKWQQDYTKLPIADPSSDPEIIFSAPIKPGKVFRTSASMSAIETKERPTKLPSKLKYKVVDDLEAANTRLSKRWEVPLKGQGEFVVEWR